ncbi:ABC transporter permease [Amycolatopsis sp. A133]|jgi:ABC-2 type transport system permease protein|uniref:ABC transporter permease n=1 Tax=Amycolatopsis sp. A133 TaxID=3064472 RepID=UPI0027FCB0B3|nr:ABC transporter permease [Amycolatopsis sp. A133]MDQ7807624.1 ABC transporter permease [Amycolatopsis sp. A133]
MSPVVAALRSGCASGRIELKQMLSSPGDVANNFFFTLILLIVLFIVRDVDVPGAGLSLGSTMLAGVVGLNIVLGGLINLSQVLVVEREDGTLLRARAVPNGVVGYLTGKIITVSALTLIRMVFLVVVGVLLFDGISVGDVAFWVTAAWVLPLGLVAMMAFGAVLGSLLTDARKLGLMLPPILGLAGLSGIFYPITEFPVWLQWIAQLFPVYWIGLGMRSALLPDSMAALEIAGSWRHVACVGVLGAWAVIGLAVAWVVVRRSARRESGSRLVVRRERAMRRSG